MLKDVETKDLLKSRKDTLENKKRTLLLRLFILTIRGPNLRDNLTISATLLISYST